MTAVLPKLEEITSTVSALETILTLSEIKAENLNENPLA